MCQLLLSVLFALVGGVLALWLRGMNRNVSTGVRSVSAAPSAANGFWVRLIRPAAAVIGARP